MQLFIRTLTGYTIVVECTLDHTVLQLKEKIFEKTDIRQQHQRLIHAGKELLDHDFLKSFDPQKAEALHLVTRNIEQSIVDEFDNDDIVLLWNIHYLQQSSRIFQNETHHLIGSPDIETAFDGYERRRETSAQDRITYLSLVAVKKSDLDATVHSPASKKYQAKNGEVREYISPDSSLPIEPLLVVKRDGQGIQVIHNAAQKIQQSEKYREKLNQLNILISSIKAKSSEPVEPTASIAQGRHSPSFFHERDDNMRYDTDGMFDKKATFS